MYQAKIKVQNGRATVNKKVKMQRKVLKDSIFNLPF
jgi:hypothetical protein